MPVVDLRRGATLVVWFVEPKKKQYHVLGDHSTTVIDDDDGHKKRWTERDTVRNLNLVRETFFFNHPD